MIDENRVQELKNAITDGEALMQCRQYSKAKREGIARAVESSKRVLAELLRTGTEPPLAWSGERWERDFRVAGGSETPK